MVLQLKSRRNIVFYVVYDFLGNEGSTYFETKPREFIVKQFQATETDSAEKILSREKKWLEILAGSESPVHVPKILLAQDDILVLEYLPGDNLCDVLNVTIDQSLAVLLGQWLAHFHNHFSKGSGSSTLLKGDVRLRNFIVQEGVLYGVDFESCHHGPFHEDVVEASAAILDTSPGIEDPLFVPVKLVLLQSFLSAYLDASTIPGARDMLADHFKIDLVTNLLEMMNRREGSYTPIQSQAIAQFIERLETGIIRLLGDPLE